MKTAIIIHWMPFEEEFYDLNIESSSNRHWFPWLQKQLWINWILAQTPEMPVPYVPNYESWKRIFEMFEVNEETILVGHSCWAGFIVRWLSENNVKVDKVALVAPWLNVSREEDIDFFEFNIDKNLVNKTKSLKVFSSKDDMDVVINSVNKLKNEVLNLDILEFENMWHFCIEDMWTTEFPELLDYLLK